MKLATTLLVITIATLLNACGAGGGLGLPGKSASSSSGSSSGSNSGSSTKLSFIHWVGSANDTWVSDANGDMVRFRADDRNLYVGKSTYVNVYVDRSARIVLDGKIIGTVAAVRGVYGNRIAALVNTDGYFYDLTGSGPDLRFHHTTKRPMPVSGYSKPDAVGLTQDDVGAGQDDLLRDETFGPAAASEGGDAGFGFLAPEHADDPLEALAQETR